MNTPQIKENVFIAKEAVVKGNVYIAEDASVWYHATVRGDRESIRIGRGSNIQDNTVVHVDSGYPVVIGDYVTVGHSAVLHGCRVGDNTLVGMGAILLNGVSVGKNCIIGAGALVTQSTVIPDNSLVIGSPAKVVRKVTPEEAAGNMRNAKQYIEESRMQE